MPELLPAKISIKKLIYTVSSKVLDGTTFLLKKCKHLVSFLEPVVVEWN